MTTVSYFIGIWIVLIILLVLMMHGYSNAPRQQ